MTTIVRPDSKTRITLGKAAKGKSSFLMEVLEDGNILLKPQVEISARELDLLKNPKLMADIEIGPQQSMQGELVSRKPISETDPELLSELNLSTTHDPKGIGASTLKKSG